MVDYTGDNQMIYTSRVVITGDTTTNKLVITMEDGRRLAVTFSPKRQPYVYVVMDDRPFDHIDKVKDFVRFLVQKLYTKEQVEMSLQDTQHGVTTSDQIVR